MNAEHEQIWATLPDKVDHPYRVAIIEALRWTGEPLAPVSLVNLLDGHVSRAGVTRHLQALERLGAVEPATAHGAKDTGERFSVPYCLVVREGGKGG